MRRRDFLRLTTATTVTAFAAAPSFAQQSTTTMRRIGVLLFNSPQTDPIGPFLEGLKTLGYAEGKNISIDYAFADGRAERLPDLAVALVDRKPEVIFAYGGDVAPHAKKATSSIPIVVMVSNDPVQSGLIASMRRPGENLTGVTMIYDELSGKLVELLKEAVPTISRVAVLWNPNHADPEFRETQRASLMSGVTLQSLEVRTAGDFAGAFDAALRERAEGLIIVSARLLLQQRQQIVEFGSKNRIIMAGNWEEWAKDGLLLTYGPSTSELMRRVAGYIDKVLKGARPTDLPMERPTRFELALNLKVAKSLGITLPNSLITRADTLLE